MASSTAGERRWASTKKSGMTVLGKLAVPKPINLPSQRLENHGLDPTVELVPKGSLSWGPRSSSSGSNPWGSSSTLSPKTEGGSASSCHLGGRPSSGGGTRPSTAGSERNPDSTSSGWPSNSRPSSASGIASNNTSVMALRPHSAETRPGSSQLSRFAEHLAEGIVEQGACSAANKMGIVASPKDGFSLSSGDFPTLGSEKSSEKNVESFDHNYNGLPGSSSDVPLATAEEREAPSDGVSRGRDVKSSMDYAWKNDAPQHFENGPHTGMERWHGDPYSYPNPNVFPHPYENWRGGPPLNRPNGVWYRGPPGAPYGAPMAGPGGFPVDPFPFYRPQVSAPGLVNSQAVPPHNSGLHGPHSKSGELCRPFAEPYMHPGMPIRPGFYPGYYGPPMGYWNPNERDLTSMGVPGGGPPVYNRYPNQNVPEPINSNVISCEGRNLEQVEHGPPNDSQRYYSAPVKQIKGRDKKSDEDQWGHQVTANAQSHDKYDAVSEEHRKDENVKHQTVCLHSEEASSVLHEDKIESKNPIYVNFRGYNSSGESADENPIVENVAFPRDHKLMKKIDGLNGMDGCHDSRREERNGRGKIINFKASLPIEEKANAGIRLERHYPSGILVPVSSNMTMVAENKVFGSTTGGVTTISRRSSHSLQASGDTGGKGRFNSQGEKGPTSECPGIVLVYNSERTTSIQGKEQSPGMQSTKMPRLEEEMMDDSSDAQRSQMREIARQRAMMLQKEEEERIREQKAKAFAKLEELNRRTAAQVKETRDKEESVPCHANAIQKQGESNIKIELQFGSIQSGEMGSTSAQGCNPVKDSKALESNVASGAICSQISQQKHQGDPVLAQKQSLPATDGACINNVAGAQNVQVSQISRQKKAGLKQENNDRSGKNLTEKPIPDAKEKSSTIVTVLKPLKEGDGKGFPSPPELNNPVDLPTASDSLGQPKRKNGRAGKNKHKVDESFAVSSTSGHKEDAFKSVTGSMNLKTVESMLEPLAVEPSFGSKDVIRSLEAQQSVSCDDAQHRGKNSWKPHHAKNMQRNSQARPMEKFHNNEAVVWAPVKPQNKIEITDDNDQKTKGVASPIRSVNAVSSSSKSKRAEMERYVPKAAKESAQQGSSQLSASHSTDQSIADGMSSKEKANSQTIASTGRRVEPRNAESKPKQMQTDGSWQLHDSFESSSVPFSGDEPSSTMNYTKKNHTFNELQPTQTPEPSRKGSAAKPVAQLVKAQSAKHDEQSAKKQSEPGEINQDTVLDHGTAGRGKKNPFKDQRGRNLQIFDHKNNSNARAYADYSETSQPDRPNSSKGKNVVQWQPKSLSHVTDQQVNGSCGQQTVAGETEIILPESKDRVSQECWVERKATLSKDHANSSKKNSVIEIESAPVGQTDGTNTEQRPSFSGHHKDGTYNGRANRGHEFRGGRNFTAQDNRQHYAPTNREKQRQNSHYEYRPVGPYSTNNIGNKLEGQSENQHAGSRFRDQGPGSHLRRGGAAGSSFPGQ